MVLLLQLQMYEDYFMYLPEDDRNCEYFAFIRFLRGVNPYVCSQIADSYSASLDRSI